MDMNVRKLRNNYAKNRLHDLTTDHTGRMLDTWIVVIQEQKVTLKTVPTLTLYFYNAY